MLADVWAGARSRRFFIVEAEILVAQASFHRGKRGALAREAVAESARPRSGRLPGYGVDDGAFMHQGPS
jgi:hypothetical protein